ncbi:MAG: NrsF family protein, partial [Pseudomonadota bacterium]|nr:NrsF family protein [Pseudomonadota bacterium]
MSDAARHESLIETLAGELRPVRRLPPPWLRALGWLGTVVVLGAGLAQISDLDALRQRLSAAPDMWLAVLGSTLTAVLAAVAAFQTSVPGRRGWWALLPLPAALLWVGASGLGCLRGWLTTPGVLVPAAHEPSLYEERTCLVFIICISVPLSLLLLAMLRRAWPLRPNLTAALG